MLRPFSAKGGRECYRPPSFYSSGQIRTPMGKLSATYWDQNGKDRQLCRHKFALMQKKQYLPTDKEEDIFSFLTPQLTNYITTTKTGEPVFIS